MVTKKKLVGRSPRVGVVMFHEGRMQFYFGQTDCEHCSKSLKVLVSVDEAREFSQMIGTTKLKFKKRVASKLQKWASEVQ